MRLRSTLIFLGMALVMTALAGAVFTVNAAAPEPQQTERPVAASPSADNAACLACHSNPQFTATFPSGEVYSLFVDEQVFNGSVHADQSVTCVGCHVGFEPEFGHDFNAASAREATLRLNTTCANCHAEQSSLEKDSVHADARAAGQMEAAICTDCHTAHAVQRIHDPQTGTVLAEARAWVPTTCERCHSEIYEKYSQSVHGAALTEENNPDVPTCIDCHGVHSIEDPTTAQFRLASPVKICAKCHTDENIMGKYGISTNVLDTYVSDFHGTTVTIFEQVAPDSATDKPVCYDCHGIHDIAAVDDPKKGLQVRENLLARCQSCHPGANLNFPDSWMSHYIPSPETYPIVYYVNLFYAFLIPGVLGGMGLLVVMDFVRMMINRFSPHKGHHGPHPEHKTHSPAPAVEAESAAAAEEDAGEEPAEVPPAGEGESASSAESAPAPESESAPVSDVEIKEETTLDEEVKKDEESRNE